MLIDKDHKNWLVFTLVTTALLTASYLIYIKTHPGIPTGDTIMGIIYGSIALAIMIFASLLGARKKVPAWRIGRGTTWLKGHLWLTLLLIPLVLFHSGFHWGGALTGLIWILFIIVMVSGVIGTIAQQFMPKLMTASVPMESIYDQINTIIPQLQYEADVKVTMVCGPLGFELVAPEGATPAKLKDPQAQEGSEPLKTFYLGTVRPALDPNAKVESLLGSSARCEHMFEQFRLSLPTALHATVEILAELVEERRQLARQKKLHHWMHGWLFVHVPISTALLLLVIVHAVMALWY